MGSAYMLIEDFLYELNPPLGMVYNVTAYMDYHPGGWDELCKVRSYT